MERLWSHLRRGLDLRVELTALRQRANGLSDVFDTITSAAFVIDSAGRVMHANLAARTLLSSATDLRVQHRRLVASTPRKTGEIQSAIGDALAFADTSITTPPLSVVSITRRTGPNLAVIVHPIRPRNALASTSARALVIIHDRAALNRVSPELVARLFSLTPTEAELAAYLAEGKTLVEFATARGCTETTARTHLKRVLEKCGVRRQAELVQRILVHTALQLPS